MKSRRRDLDSVLNLGVQLEGTREREEAGAERKGIEKKMPQDRSKPATDSCPQLPSAVRTSAC